MGQSSSRPPARGHGRHASQPSPHAPAQQADRRARDSRANEAAAAAEREREARLYAGVSLDHGALAPANALYDADAADWEPRVVRKLILERKIAPFYRGLSDPEDGESTTTSRPKAPESPPVPPIEVPEPAPTPIMIAMGQTGPGFGDGGPVVSLGRSGAASSPIPAPQPHSSGPLRFIRHGHTSSTGSLVSVQSASSLGVDQEIKPRSVSASVTQSGPSSRNQVSGDLLLSAGNLKPWVAREDLYRNPIECPICFLYYPRNVNWSRCCDQPICTECFVTIHRPESGDPAACPFCVEPHFGIIYYPPNTPAYLEKLASSLPDDEESVEVERPSSSLLPPSMPSELYSQSMPADISPISRMDEEGSRPDTPQSGIARKREGKRRRESMGYKTPGVVTVDDLRPDWFKKHQQLLLARAIQQQQRRYASLLAAGRAPPPPEPTSPSADESAPDLIGAATAAAALVESVSGANAGDPAARRRTGATLGMRPPRPARGGNQALRDQVAIAGYFDAMRHMGADLEELMMMEAVRRSLQDLSTSEQADGVSGENVPVSSPSAQGAASELGTGGGPVDTTTGDEAATIEDGPTKAGQNPDDSSSPVVASFLDDSESNGNP